MIWHLVSVCFIEDRPAEEDHIEDDDEAVKYWEGRHLFMSLRIKIEKEEEVQTSRRKDVLKSREARQMMYRVTRFPGGLIIKPLPRSVRP